MSEKSFPNAFDLIAKAGKVNKADDKAKVNNTEENKIKKEDKQIIENKADNKMNDAIKLDTDTDKYTHMYTDKIPTKETKSKRLNLLIYPSLHEDLERLAEMQAIKVNELINRILKEYTETEESQKMIENHKQIKRKHR